MDSLKTALGVSGVSSHMSSSLTSVGKEGKEDLKCSSASILPGRICRLVGIGGGTVALQQHLVGVMNATLSSVGLMFDMVENLRCVEREECPDSVVIELIEELVIILL